MYRFIAALIISTVIAGCGGGHHGGGGAPMTVTPPTPPAWSSPATLNRGFINVVDDRLLMVSGGTGPFNFTVTAGALPNGVSLSNGAAGAHLTGTPSLDGLYSFTLTVIDAVGGSASQAFAWRISDPIVIAALPTTTLTKGTPFSATLSASGGVGGPYANWTTTANQLPPGLTLTPAGVLSGTPTASGSFTFPVSCSDSGTDPNTGSKSFTGTVS